MDSSAAVFARIGTGAAGTTGATTSGRALGLRVDAPFGFSGLRGASGPGDGRWVRLDLVSDAELQAAWPGTPAGDATRSGHNGTEIHTAHHPEAGYLVTSASAGRCLVAPDGHHIQIANGPHPQERWQGLVAAQALPLAAILQGLEVFNASAVVVAGQVMAFTGPPGVGKSALAMQLMLVGARFFADDLVALEVRGEQIVAHAGLGVARLGTRARSAVPQLTAQGADVIGSDGKTLVECSRDVPTLPLRSLYLLSDVDADEDARSGIAAQTPDPSRLLAGTHNLSVRTSERLRRHFELVAQLGARVGVFGASLRRGDERELARAIYAHAALEVLR